MQKTNNNNYTAEKDLESESMAFPEESGIVIKIDNEDGTFDCLRITEFSQIRSQATQYCKEKKLPLSFADVIEHKCLSEMGIQNDTDSNFRYRSSFKPRLTTTELN